VSSRWPTNRIRRVRHPRQNTARANRTNYRVCIVAARWSTPLFLLVGCLFFVYLVGGSIAVSLRSWSPSYEFLSLSEDVYFAWLGFLSGTTICVGTGSLIGLVLFTEGDVQIHNEISILASFAGFGFGAGLLRITHVTVLTSLIQTLDHRCCISRLLAPTTGLSQ